MNRLLERYKRAKANQKGFTLVELIVVIVILGILIAILVPGLTKWIDKAKDKQIIVDARSAYLATQTLISEEYAKPTPNYTDNVTKAKIQELAGVKGEVDYTLDDTEKSKIKTFTYSISGKTASYNATDEKWDVTTGSSSSPSTGG